MNKFSVQGTSVSLGLTLTTVFVLCALVQAIAPEVRASHMWVSLFTSAESGTLRMWLEGILANLVFGTFAGFLFGHFYNRFAR
jgi:hypothetical protein